MTRQERIEKTLVLWTAGQTAPQIAKAFGTKTHGWVAAILAYARRQGDMRAASRQKPPTRKRGKDAGIVNRIYRSAQRAARAKEAPPQAVGEDDAPIVERAGPVRGDAFIALSGKRPIGIMRLTSTTCRWPIDGLTTRYCGCRCAANASYCTPHSEMACGKPVLSQDRAIRKVSARPKISRSFIAEEV